MKWLFLLTGFLLYAAAPAQNLIQNGSFEEAEVHWTFSSERTAPFDRRFQPVSDGAGQWAVIETKPDAPVGFSRISQPLQQVPSGPLRLSFRAVSENVEGGNGAYAYLEFMNAEGGRISGLQSQFAPGSGEPARFTLVGEVPAGTRRIVLRLILHGRGTARFTDVSLVELRAEDREFASRVTLNVPPLPEGAAFFGVGAEDDGWAYTRGNAAKGWTEADSALREKRLRWLKPGFVRTFLWTHDWLPQSFWRGEEYSYLFDHDLFQSKLRTWRLYHEIGTHVNLAQVSWDQGGVWKIPDRHIPAIGDLFEYLHGQHSLTNIRSYSVYNEPNHSMYAGGGTFEIYTRYHEDLAAEFARRNLNIALTGSDDGNGSAWFRRCVETPGIRDNVAYYASHQYIAFPTLNPDAVDEFFNDRMGVLERSGIDKPFVVSEFGFTGSGTSHYKNPYMAEPDYALAAMDFVLRGLNRGARGFCFWTMHEMVYPPYKEKPNSHWNQIMTWALWDFEGKLKPVYHAAALMMRNMRPDLPVYPVKSDAPGTVQAVRVGDGLFWVNLSPRPVEITVEGMHPKRVGFILADEPPADFVEFNRSADAQLSEKGAIFTVPGRSYGRAK